MDVDVVGKGSRVVLYDRSRRPQGAFALAGLRRLA